ncbi:MAG TPA: C39 family peptidase, partial [Anaerolineales bacterium]|nr:C39 family peptidase [Anaerolineales bacterium]
MLFHRYAVHLSVLTLIILASPAAAVRAGSLPESALISGVQGHTQGYNLSCESRSAADWAAFWGVEISESEFLSNLPPSDNPDMGFVGDPNDAWGYTPPYSYGVHAGPVAALLRSYGLQAEAQHGLRWKNLRKEVAAGRPVIVWVIGQMWTGNSRSYTAADGNAIRVAPFEHTMILIGYDSSTVTVVDAYSGGTQTYSLQTFLDSWSVLDNMAVF